MDTAGRNPGNTSPRPARWIIIAVLGWAIGVGLCGATLLQYTNTPGLSAETPRVWPDSVPRANHAPALIMFAHPHCPCTRASLSELARLLAETPARPDVRILFCKPALEPDEWVRGWNWNAATAIPGALAQIDVDGALAARFGAATSGHTVLYDAAGTLQYSGGITVARGHEGDNLGRASIVSSLRGEHRPAAPAAPVFGCELIHADAPIAACCKEVDP
jgi:hypothetical protein